MRRFPKEFKRNRRKPLPVRFIGVMILLAVVVGLGTAWLSNGLHGLFDKASLAQKALDNPEALTESEKTELKKAFPDKASAKKAFESMSSDQQEKARRAFGNMSEEEQAQAREQYRP